MGPSQAPVTVKSSWSQCRGAVGMCTWTHTRALSLQTSAHLSREAARCCPGLRILCSRLQHPVRPALGWPNILHHRLGRNPRLCFRCDWGQWKGLPKPRFGRGWKLTRTLLSARQIGAIRICGLCFGFLFVCFFSFIFELRLKRTLSMWRMLNRLLYD